MEDITIEALIAQRRVVTTADLTNPANDYMVVGVYQNGTNKMRGDGTSYKNYVISIAELLGGGSAYTASNGVVLIGNDFQLASGNNSKAWAPDGNSFGAEKYIGTIDNFAVPVYTNGTQVARFTETGEFIIGSAINSSGQLVRFERNQDSFTNVQVVNTNTHPDASAAFVVESDTVIAFFGAGSSVHSSFSNVAAFGAVTSDLYIAAGIAGLPKDTIFFNGGLAPGNENMRVTSFGDVGIGISTPNSRLHVRGVDATATNFVMKLDDISGNPLVYTSNTGETSFLNTRLKITQVAGYSMITMDEAAPSFINYSILKDSGKTIINGSAPISTVSLRYQNNPLVTLNNPGLNTPILDLNNVISNNALTFYGQYSIGIAANKFLINTNVGGALQIGDYDGTTVLGKFYFDTSTIRLGIATLSPTSNLHIAGDFGYEQFRLETSYTPANSADPNGATGDIAWDDSYIYTKVSTGWKRAALTVF